MINVSLPGAETTASFIIAKSFDPKLPSPVTFHALFLLQPLYLFWGALIGGMVQYLGANDGDRTRDTRLGKPMLYQLSYIRLWRQTASKISFFA